MVASLSHITPPIREPPRPAQAFPAPLCCMLIIACVTRALRVRTLTLDFDIVMRKGWGYHKKIVITVRVLLDLINFINKILDHYINQFENPSVKG